MIEQEEIDDSEDLCDSCDMARGGEDNECPECGAMLCDDCIDDHKNDRELHEYLEDDESDDDLD